MTWTVEDNWGELDSQRTILKSNAGENEINCNTNNIQWKSAHGWSSSGARRKLNIKDIKFVTANCTDGTFSKTCEIQIQSDKDLEWKEGYKPKITYSAF